MWWGMIVAFGYFLSMGFNLIQYIVAIWKAVLACDGFGYPLSLKFGQ